MNFAETTQYLLSLGHETLAMKLGLRNTELLLESLGSPEKAYESVQIAGTNGKGSTAVMLDYICRAAGVSTGLYTSPHLVSITERIKINGNEITEDSFAELASEVRRTADTLVADGKLEGLPTFFEHVTAIALLAFRDAGVDLAILETGLGGRLDATTAVRADIVAITPIALDHQKYLGETLAEIAAEKAAIIRPNSVAVISPQPEEARRVILARCRECGLTPAWATKDFCEAGIRLSYTFRTEKDSYEEVRPGLRGIHQLTNAATAIALAECLAARFTIGHDAIIAGLQTARHPGRLEVFETSAAAAEKVFVLLDGAHNPAGAAALRAYIDGEPHLRDASITLLFGAMADKQLDEMAAVIFPVAARLILTQPRNPRAATVQDLLQLAKKYARGLSLDLCADSDTAMEQAIAGGGPPNKLICVAGSLYLVGEVRQWLQKRYGPAGRFS
jgi:dihydrofolate synthase/folylpolyglutamate synthase